MKKQIDAKLRARVKELTRFISHASLISWFKEIDVNITGTSTEQFVNNASSAIEEGEITFEQLERAIAEIEENGGKKIFLQKIVNFKDIDIKKLIAFWKTKNITPSKDNYVRVKSGVNPKFNYLYLENNIIKIKYSETQFQLEPNVDTKEFEEKELIVNIVCIVDCNDGFTQIRFDSPGNVHKHKNDEGKSTEHEYESYYINLFHNLFPELNFQDFSLNDTANYIARNEKEKFRLNKEVTSITDGAKQIYTSRTSKKDIRDLIEQQGAEKAADLKVWLSEDLTGYWLADSSEDQLSRDLFMRISIRHSQIRVQRDCLEKELNYGLDQLREIQKEI